MIKNIVILGSNNDLGNKSFDFFKSCNKYKIIGLSFDSKLDNIDFFLNQINEINPKRIFLPNKEYVSIIESKSNAELFVGQENYPIFIKSTEIDHVISALSGITSVKKILSSIYEYKDITLLNTSPLLYSGKIIINEAKSKAVKLNIFSYSVYSLNFLGNLNVIDKIKKINLFSNKKSKDIDIFDYKNYILFLKDFYSKNKIRLVNDMFLIYYLYDIPYHMFDFYQQTEKFSNISVNFNNGTSILFNSNLDINSIFNYYFLNNKKDENSSSQTFFKNISFSKIDLRSEKYLQLGLFCTEKGGSYPIVYYITVELLSNYIYNGKISFKENDIYSILKEIVEDKALFKKYPDLSSVISIEEQIIKRLNKISKKKL
jgi:1-deoxy-D-xylulose 5-phosphate reductoisomerase